MKVFVNRIIERYLNKQFIILDIPVCKTVIVPTTDFYCSCRYIDREAVIRSTAYHSTNQSYLHTRYTRL